MTPNPEPLPARAWLIVGLLWVVAFLNYLDRLILITMRSSIKEAIPMNDAQFGLLTTVFLVTYGLLGPLGGFLADKFNRSRIIIFSLFAWSATTWLTAHATTYGELLWSRALMGISEACYFPAAGALLMAYHRHGTRSLANGIHLSGVMIGSGLGGLGGWIADKHDWTFVFSLFGLVGIGYTAVLLAFLRDRPADAVAPDMLAPPKQRLHLVEALTSLFSRKAFVLALLFWGLLGLASWAFVGWLPVYLQEEFHLSQGRAGMTAFGYKHAASLAGMVIGGALADRWFRVHPRGRIWVCMIGVLLAAPAVLLVANTATLSFVLAGLVTYGFVRVFADANMVPILCQIVDPRYLATGLGLLNTFAVLVGGLTIYVGGALRDADVSISTVFNFGAAGLVGCAAILWFVRPRPDAPIPCR